MNFAWGGYVLPIACVSPSSVFGRPSGEEEERRRKGREREEEGRGEVTRWEREEGGEMEGREDGMRKEERRRREEEEGVRRREEEGRRKTSKTISPSDSGSCYHAFK